jgi:predicted nucleotidyltransferase
MPVIPELDRVAAPLRDVMGRLSGVLAAEGPALACAYLFGSHARGEAHAGSDIDVAVLFTEDPPRTLAGLHLDLADRLTEAIARPVDLVVLNRAPVDLAHRVLRDGVLLLERDRSARIRFEVRARNEYFDLLPHIQRYRRGREEAAE